MPHPSRGFVREGWETTEAYGCVNTLTENALAPRFSVGNVNHRISQKSRRDGAENRIGLSGATGRAIGPHLHWAVRWQGAYLDPEKFLRLKLVTLR